MLKHSVSAIALGIALGLAPAAFAQDTQTQQPAAQDQQGTQQGGADVIVVQPEGQQQQGGQQGDTDVIVVQPEGQQQGTTATQDQTTTQPAEVQTTQPAEVETTTQPVEVQTTQQPAEGQQMDVQAVPEGQQGQEGQPVPGQIFQQSPNQFLASTLMDANVQSADGENMGDVQDIIITQEGQVEGVVIGVGGFLGIGQKNVAVELSQITIQQDPNNPDNLTFMLNVTREELENAPEFQTQRDVQAQQGAATGAAGTTGAGGVVTTDPVVPGGAVTTDPAAGGATTQGQSQ